MNYQYLSPGSCNYYGIMDEMVRFSMQHQLLKEQNWKDFVEVYRSNSDDWDMGWRCEYWGKMMRGAVLTYLYNKDEDLYAVMEKTVKDLLTVQQEDGRFSTYSYEKELSGGWDVWGRKYILTGCLHFYRICQSEALKKDILLSMMRHADALIEKIGDGKISIFATSTHWKGVNSVSILEPMLDLYQITGEKRYLAFAEYLIASGGCEDGDLIELALENELAPYQYPTVKAYETMSFFEGVLAYYEVTGEEKYLKAVMNFMDAVDETDLTVIGSCGCTHELFDHSSLKQILYSNSIMQETCVTVTWIRLNARLYQLNGDVRCIDRIEQAGYNALYGSVNTKLLPQLSIEDQTWVDPLPFDSYSPLYNQKRGRGIGGFKRFSFGGYYGCCACIASAGTALVPLVATMQREKRGKISLLCNLPVNGTAQFHVKGQEIRMTESTSFPVSYQSEYVFEMENEASFEVMIRVPSYVEDDFLYINGEQQDILPMEGYYSISRNWKNGDKIELVGSLSVRELVSTAEMVDEETSQEISRVSFLYGPIALAADEEKDACIQLGENSGAVIDLEKELTFSLEDPMPGELLRGSLSDGDMTLCLSDYQSCGKNWRGTRGNITVWFDIE